MANYQTTSIKKLTKQIFNLKDPDYMVLGTIARLGHLNKNKINDSLANSTLRQVRWRIDNILLPSEFLQVKVQTPYHNIQRAFKTKNRKGKKLIERKYGLTMKGFLASLGFCSFKENYLIKEFLKDIPQELKDDTLELIKTQLMIFLLDNIYLGIKFDTINDNNWIRYQIEKTEDEHIYPVSTSELPPVKMESMQKRKYKKFHKNYVKILKKIDKKIKGDNYKLFSTIESWATQIFYIVE